MMCPHCGTPLLDLTAGTELGGKPHECPVGAIRANMPTKPLAIYAVGNCANCKTPLDSRTPRSPRTVIYVIGNQLCCSKRCVKQAFGAEVAAALC